MKLFGQVSKGRKKGIQIQGSEFMATSVPPNNPKVSANGVMLNLVLGLQR